MCFRGWDGNDRIDRYDSVLVTTVISIASNINVYSWAVI